MKFKSLKIATALVIMPFATNTMAANTVITGTFKTIKNVDINEVTPMVINGLYPQSGSICTMATPAFGANWVGETVMQLANVGATATLSPGVSAGAMSGVGCSTALAGTPGIYEVTGADGADVTVTLTDVAGNIDFEPIGCVGDYNNGADGDTCEPVSGVAGGVGPVTVTLASTGDVTNSAGQGQPVVGSTRIALGGTITANIGLTAAQPYDVPFDITVTY